MVISFYKSEYANGTGVGTKRKLKTTENLYHITIGQYLSN